MTPPAVAPGQVWLRKQDRKLVLVTEIFLGCVYYRWLEGRKKSSVSARCWTRRFKLWGFHE